VNAIKNAIGGLWSIVLRNPVRAQALVVSVIALGTAFGLSWTAEQVGAVTALSAAILAFFTEQTVTPIESPALPANTTVTVITPAGTPDKVVTV
jgi:hypothetical protein